MTNPIFNALTRPAMTAGVTFEYHIFNLMISMCAFIGFGILYGLVFIPLHLIGVLICRYEVHFFTLLAIRFLKLPEVTNIKYWKVRAYEPF